jgi:uncharacterized protein
MKPSVKLMSILVVLLILSTHSVSGQKFEPRKREPEPDTTLTSKIMGKDYQLYISFPNGYSSNDTVPYPVLYVLDGRLAFPLFNSIREIREPGKELEDVIIVCIDCGLDFNSWFVNRFYDYTPSSDTTVQRNFEKHLRLPEGAVQAGGAEKFLECITTEIIPYIDKHYKTNNDRGITGHSLGGLFAAYCMLHSEGVFNRYGINSPSLWWNNSELQTQAESLFTETNPLPIPPTSIFISVGAQEGPTMVPIIEKFSALLGSRADHKLVITSHIFEDETHSSVVPASCSRTLSVLYKRQSLEP